MLRQQLGHVLRPPARVPELDRVADRSGEHSEEARETRLVVIGRSGLDRAAIAAALAG